MFSTDKPTSSPLIIPIYIPVPNNNTDTAFMIRGDNHNFLNAIFSI